MGTAREEASFKVWKQQFSHAHLTSANSCLLHFCKGTERKALLIMIHLSPVTKYTSSVSNLDLLRAENTAKIMKGRWEIWPGKLGYPWALDEAKAQKPSGLSSIAHLWRSTRPLCLHFWIQSDLNWYFPHVSYFFKQVARSLANDIIMLMARCFKKQYLLLNWVKITSNFYLLVA